jgi:tetratricopeptide (TPR) repeat protein
VPALQWAALPTDANRAMARAEAILVGPPVRDREEAAQGLATLGMARYVRGDVPGGRRLFQLSLDRSPHPRMLVQWGIIANLAGRPAEALAYFQRSTTLNPELASAWQGVAESAAALRDTSSLREAITQLERLEPANPVLAAARQQLAEARQGSAPARGDPRVRR